MTRILLLAAAFLAPRVFCGAADPYLPQFRGPNGSGVAQQGNPPVHFGLTSNVLWKIESPAGHSSPCVWADRIFLTAADSTALETLCIDRRTGKVLWRQAAPA